MGKKESEEERKKKIAELCKVDEKSVILVQKFNDGYNKLLFEMYDREEAMDFDEYYKRFDEMIKSDENFTLEFIKPKSYQYSELLPLKLQRLISDEKIPDDKEIIYRIYYLNSLPNKTSNEAVNFAKETIKMIKEKNKRG